MALTQAQYTELRSRYEAVKASIIQFAGKCYEFQVTPTITNDVDRIYTIVHTLESTVASQSPKVD